MSYNHLTASERLELYEFRLTTNLSLREIARKMNRSQSSLSREIKRNQVCKGMYLPDSAQNKAEARRRESKPRIREVEGGCIEEIKNGLKEFQSPEQISGRMKLKGKKTLSHESIYKMIYENHYDMGKYQQYLRQGRERRRKRYSKKSIRGRIPGRIGIENRPQIANQKTEIGHWESDTIIGGNHNGLLVTHVDKASKYLLAGLAKNKTTEAVNAVTCNLFSEIPRDKRKTMTSDNGKEFTNHEELARKLGLDYFFANPYHPWERGLNEHTNGLLRQFFPKKTNFKTVKLEDVEKAVRNLNHRPRKSLGYLTPYEVFYQKTSDTDALQI